MLVPFWLVEEVSWPWMKGFVGAWCWFTSWQDTWWSSGEDACAEAADPGLDVLADEDGAGADGWPEPLW